MNSRKEYHRKWYQENRERERAKQKEYHKKYYIENKEKISANQRRYYLAHRQEVLKRAAKYRIQKKRNKK